MAEQIDISVSSPCPQEEQEEKKKESNPIIFARSKTTHLPKELLQRKSDNSVPDFVYQSETDGSLKVTPMPPIYEEEEEEKPKKESALITWFRSLWSLFRLCNQSSSNEENDATSPLVTTSKQEMEMNDDFPIGPFLDKQADHNLGKKTLVLDLDETLVHSTFQETNDSDYTIPVEIEGNVYNVYVYLRPGAIEFIQKMSELYEVIIYTASLSIYADPLLDRMDQNHSISARLFRNHCILSGGVYVKDLGMLGRDLSKVIMIDNASTSFKFQPTNGIECIPFIDNKNDTELMNMIPFLEFLAMKDDVRLFSKQWDEQWRNNVPLQ